ncbi:hypothetical protein KKB18_03255, partial [bacterium]|nr:hypothetical protein [bacterium]
NIKDKLEHYLGDKIISEGIFFQRNDEATDINIIGFLGSPFFPRKTKSYQFLFVNKRAIYSKLLISAVYNAYQPYIPDFKEHPIYAISLECPPYLVDVNVHPAKIEVRFKNSNLIYKNLLETISYHLNTADFKPAFYRENLQYDQKHRKWDDYKNSEFTGKYKTPFPEYRSAQTNQQLDNKESSWKSTKLDFHDNGKLIPLSQLNNTYIIAKGFNQIILIDQHTAHERILYEKFISELKEERIPSQRFLFPLQLEVTPEDIDIITDNGNLITASGFDIEQKGGNNLIIQAAPVLIHEGEVEKSFLNLVDDIRNEGCDIDRERLIDRMAKTLACHSAVRSGEELTNEKMQELVHLLNQTNTPSVCPHGRPTMVELDVNEIEKIFKRK